MFHPSKQGFTVLLYSILKFKYSSIHPCYTLHSNKRNRKLTVSRSMRLCYSGGLSSLSLSTTSHQFSLSVLTTSPPAAACTSIQYSRHNHISISYVRLLSLNQFHHFRLNHFKIHFVDNEFEKIIA
jgi:hypothetical protein